MSRDKAGGAGSCGGMYNSGGSPTVTNCIFWGDTPDEFNASSGATVTYSDVQGGWGGAGGNNIDADPCFVNAGGGDLRVLYISPCIDAGDNICVPNDVADLDNDGNTVEPMPWDLDSRPRIVDGDCNDIDVVDMGAYEFNYAYMGDLDYNCSVDFFDFSILGRAWMTQEGDADYDPGCDISEPGDDYIDWRDAAVLCEKWLEKLYWP